MDPTNIRMVHIDQNHTKRNANLKQIQIQRVWPLRLYTPSSYTPCYSYLYSAYTPDPFSIYINPLIPLADTCAYDSGSLMSGSSSTFERHWREKKMRAKRSRLYKTRFLYQSKGEGGRMLLMLSIWPLVAPEKGNVNRYQEALLIQYSDLNS